MLGFLKVAIYELYYGILSYLVALLGYIANRWNESTEKRFDEGKISKKRKEETERRLARFDQLKSSLMKAKI